MSARHDESSPPAPDDASAQALRGALRLLSMRARSRHELLAWLSRRGFGAAVRASVLEKLERLGYLDDRRFARDRALALLRDGRYGPAMVVHRLGAQGIADREAREAAAFAQEELGFDPLASARALLKRRGLSGRRLSDRERARAARLLSARGFDEATLERLLGDPMLDSGQPED